MWNKLTGLTRMNISLPCVDVVALDARNEPVLAAEVKAHPFDREQVLLQLANAVRQSEVEWLMTVDLEQIALYHREGEVVEGPRLTLVTSEVLSAYDVEIGHKHVYESYLTALVEAWLRDLAYGWSSQSVPGWEQLRELGLTARLHEGTTETEFQLLPA